MTAPLSNPHAHQRYTLKLTHYPSPHVVNDVALLLYQSTAPTLIASLASLPYTVGRTFSYEELEVLHGKLKNLGIGHRFESMDGVSEVISFHPGDQQREQEMTSNRKKVRRQKTTTVALAILVVITIAAAIVFSLRDPSSKASRPVSREPIAEISSIESRVQRRSQPELQWKEAKTGESLFEKDALRTFENSQAVIDYREGSTLTIREDSFVIIERPASKTTREVSLEDGSIQARLKKSDQNLELKIHTSQGSIRLVGPTSAEGAEVNLQTSMRSGNLAVAVESGQVEITPKGQPPISIGPSQKVEVKEDVAPVIAPYETLIEVKHPQPGARLKEGDFNFETAAVSGAKKYRWIIASNKEMKTILVEHRTQEPTLKLQYLDPGELYWKVEAVGEDGMIHSSRPQQVYVQ